MSIGYKELCEQRKNPGSILLPTKYFTSSLTNIRIDDNIMVDFNIHQSPDRSPSPIVHVFQTSERTQFIQFPINY